MGRVSVRYFGVGRRLFVLAGIEGLCSFPMMICRRVVMLCGQGVMLTRL